MKAKRIPAKDVKVGDQILVLYHSRTWMQVEHVEHHQPIGICDLSIMVDTPKTRTWYRPDDLVPCRRPRC